MFIKFENMPSVNRDSWIGRLVKFTGAKSWCSLFIRLKLLLLPVLIYFHGFLFLFGLYEIDEEFFPGFLQFLNAGFTVGITGVLAVGGIIYLFDEGIPKLNRWLQNSCSQIEFKE